MSPEGSAPQPGLRTPGIPAPRVPAAVWRMALAAGLASYLDAAALIAVSLSLTIWRDHYHLTVWEVGTVSAGLAFATAVGSLVGGWLGDRLGRGPVFTWDLVGFVLGTVIAVTASNGTVLTLGVLIVGLAAGADIPTSLAVISDAAPQHVRGRVIALTQSLWIAGILATLLLGFAVADLGFLGTQILVGHLVVLAGLTLALRVVLTRRPHPPAVDGTRPETAEPPVGIRLRDLAAPGVALPLLATGCFFVSWNFASTALGSYGTYFLVRVTGLSQSQATGLALVTFPLALIMSLVFVRLADTVWRDRLFAVAMLVQISAFAVGALSGGRAVQGMVALVILYSLSNVFGGEAIYKVWSQLLFPPQVRASAMGLTYGLARGVAAAFVLVVPVVVESHPAALLWVQTGCVTVSGLTGLVITRHRRIASVLRAATLVR